MKTAVLLVALVGAVGTLVSAAGYSNVPVVNRPSNGFFFGSFAGISDSQQGFPVVFVSLFHSPPSAQKATRLRPTHTATTVISTQALSPLTARPTPSRTRFRSWYFLVCIFLFRIDQKTKQEDGGVLAIAQNPTNGNIFIGGYFKTLGSAEFNSIAEWDGEKFTAIGEYG